MGAENLPRPIFLTHRVLLVIPTPERKRGAEGSAVSRMENNSRFLHSAVACAPAPVGMTNLKYGRLFRNDKHGARTARAE